MKPAYDQLALEKTEAIERGFHRDSAGDLTEPAAPAELGDAQPVQAAVDAAVAELRAVKFLNGQLKATTSPSTRPRKPRA
jgi:hypothetical protein